MWVMLFIFSKVPELVDTVFIVFRKSKLQVRTPSFPPSLPPPLSFVVTASDCGKSFLRL